MPTSSTCLHATSVAIDNKGLLILGPSGSGKSALAIQLIVLGAELVADDRTDIQLTRGALYASRPPRLPQAIEARGVGLIAMPTRDPVCVELAVDLSETETTRFPLPAVRQFLGHPVTVFKSVPDLYFPSALLLYLKHGRFTGKDT